MAQRVVEHAAVGLLSGLAVGVLVHALRLRVAAWGECAVVGGCAAVMFTILDGQPTDFAWTAGVAGASALIYVAGVAITGALTSTRG